jgi:hypothetical protein
MISCTLVILTTRPWPALFITNNWLVKVAIDSFGIIIIQGNLALN